MGRSPTGLELRRNGHGIRETRTPLGMVTSFTNAATNG